MNNIVSTSSSQLHRRFHVKNETSLKYYLKDFYDKNEMTISGINVTNDEEIRNQEADQVNPGISIFTCSHQVHSRILCVIEFKLDTFSLVDSGRA